MMNEMNESSEFDPSDEASAISRRSWLMLIALLVVLAPLSLASFSAQRDPANWGSDHVGKPIPEYSTGDECLFCHRVEVGSSWLTNRHNRTMRDADSAPEALAALQRSPAHKSLADEVKFVIGHNNRLRFLKPSEAHGKLELLSTEWQPPQSGNQGKLLHPENPHWDKTKYADNCAGCHTTAVETKNRSFSALSLDCFTCHGDVEAKHTKDSKLVLLAVKRKDEPRVITSICAQCHVRSGKSLSTGLPYPNQFVAGDNLFRDFQVDFAADAVAKLNPADRHVMENIRDVVLLGKEEVTCLSCHDVHKSSTKKHHRLETRDDCATCHNPTGSKKVVKPFTVHSELCGY